MTTPNNSRMRRQPLDYRQEEVGRIMQRWNASESCSLIGVGSVGKSNLIQHLANPEVQSEYMKMSNGQHFKTIIIDPSMLGPLPANQKDVEQIGCWLGYELMMHRLYLAFHQSDLLTKDEIKRFGDIYQQLADGSNPLYAYMGLRYFELGLDIIMNKGIRIVFMFDEFEEMLRNLPVKFFLTLRGLRDANKKQLSYLTFTRVPMLSLVEEYEIEELKIEEFTELFTDNIFYIGPYDNRDAHRMVDELCKRNNKEYDDHMKAFLVWSTGGFAGLLRASFRMLDKLPELDLNAIMTHSPDMAQRLSRMASVRVECKTIWLSLSAAERYVLKTAAGLAADQSEVQPEAAEQLVRKKLLSNSTSGQAGIAINPPIFHYFVLNDSDASL